MGTHCVHSVGMVKDSIHTTIKCRDKLAIAAERKRSQNATGGCVIVRCSVSAPVWWQKSLRDTQQVAAWFP